jgi:glucokinase
VTVGVDVGGTKVLAVALGSDGDTPVGENRRATPDGADELIDAIADAARDAAGDAGGDIAGLCVGVPGLVDDRGVMRFGANLPGVLEQPLRDIFGERFGVPVLIDNDANVAAWGERVAGAGEGSSHMLMVTLGTGVGGGIVLDGHLYRGAHGMAGEIGHFVVQLDGEQCPCGQRGCWERYASGSALGRIAREAGFASGEDAAAKAKAGDQAALDVLDVFTRWVAIGLAGFANTFDPERIVLGGGLVELGDLLLSPLRAHFARLIEGGEPRPPVPILPATLGERAGAIGAALLARDI